MSDERLEASRAVVRGAVGTVKWGYRPAMNIAGWTFSGSGAAGGVVTATVTSREAFLCSQRPLTLALTVGRASVRWPVLTLVEEGTAVTITVGPK